MATVVWLDLEVKSSLMREASKPCAGTGMAEFENEHRL
jgi:hypothetical protein